MFGPQFDGYLFSDACKISVKTEITSRKVADFKKWKDHDSFEEGLVQALRADDGRKAPPPEQKL